MHNLGHVRENETHKILWDFEIQTNHLILARRLNQVMVKKKTRTCRIVEFAVSANHRVKLKETEKKDKYLDFVREVKKLCNIKVTVIPNVTGALRAVTRVLIQELKDLEIRGRAEGHLNYSNIKIGQNTKKVSWRLEPTCCHSNSCEKQSAHAGVKKL